jgi:F-type H+-transporting ATPase subunit b
MEKLGLNLGTLLVYLFNFTALLIILQALVYKRVVKVLEERQKKIAKGLEDAKVAADARAKAELEAQHILSQAQQDASRKIQDASENADRTVQEVRAAAEKEIAAMREAARVEAQAERNRILQEVRPKVAVLAISAAQKIIGETLDEKRQRALIDEFFSGVRSGKVTLLEEEGGLPPGSTAEVLSALPLTETEQASIRKEVARKAGAGVAVAFDVDPDLLGGLKIRIGDRVIDGTVAGQIDSLRRSMS